MFFSLPPIPCASLSPHSRTFNYANNNRGRDLNPLSVLSHKYTLFQLFIIIVELVIKTPLSPMSGCLHHRSRKNLYVKQLRCY
jgi:hypothetical protein